MSNHASLVREFTEQSMGIKCPDAPVELSESACKFIVRMVLSELAELYQTVNANISREELIDLMKKELNTEHIWDTELFDGPIVKAQMNVFAAICGIISMNAIAYNFNLNRLFTLVHAANMAKRFPDGTFHCREDGKVIKPDNWKEADILAEVTTWFNNGDRPIPLDNDDIGSLLKTFTKLLSLLYDVDDAINTIDFTPRGAPANEVALVAEQADALVDAYYYILNTAAKHGINLDA